MPTIPLGRDDNVPTDEFAESDSYVNVHLNDGRAIKFHHVTDVTVVGNAYCIETSKPVRTKTYINQASVGLLEWVRR